MKQLICVLTVFVIMISCSNESEPTGPNQDQSEQPVTPLPIPDPYPTYQIAIIQLLRLYLCAVSVVVLTSKPAVADFIFTPISGSSSHQFSSPYSGKFQAINGDSFDVSEYYASLSTELHLNGLVMWDINDRVTATVPWNFDAGYKSDLFKTDPVLQLGLSVNVSSPNQSIRFGITNLITIGGSVTEKPCVDILFRDFHCGTGLPWVDRPSPTKSDVKVYSIIYQLVF